MPRWVYFAGFLIIILLLFYLTHDPTIPARSDVDGRIYYVLPHYPGQRAAANLMARINTSILELLRYLRGKYMIDATAEEIAADPARYAQIRANGERHAIFSALLNNYNFETLYENDPLNIAGETSYTINKGDKMYLCIRRRSNPTQLIEYNTLMFCMLHEISHIANYNGWGHDTRFWAIFKAIIIEADIIQIYKPIDYAQHPTVYCGLTITYCPYFDTSLPDI